MMFIGVFPAYFWWHYATAPFMGMHLCRNLFFAIQRLFPVTQLLRNLFAPWHRVHESKGGKHFDIEAWAGRIVVNIMSRFIGAFMRLVVIGIGIVSYLVSLFGILLLYSVWFFAPIIIVGMFALGLEAFL